MKCHKTPMNFNAMNFVKRFVKKCQLFFCNLSLNQYNHEKFHLIYFTIYLSFGLLFASCDTPAPHTPSYPNAIPCPDDFKGGILIGGCIEGLKPYDNISKITTKLGQANQLIQETPEFKIYLYRTPDQDIQIVASKEKNAIYSITVLQYNNIISNNIKMNMEKADVLKLLGKPQSILQDSPYQEEHAYIFTFKHETYQGTNFLPNEEPLLSFRLSYNSNLLRSISLSPGKIF